MTHSRCDEEGGAGTFPAEEGYRSRRAQAFIRAGASAVLTVCVVAMAGYRPWYAAGPSGNPFRQASIEGRTSWKLDDLGQSRREEFTGLLQALGADSSLVANSGVSNSSGTSSGNATSGDLEDVPLLGGKESNWSFPIMPNTEEEWKQWEEKQGYPKACVPVLHEEIDPEGNVVQTFYPDCSEEAIKKYHEEIARQQATLLKPRAQSLAAKATKTAQTDAAVNSKSISELMKAVAASKQALAKERSRLESLQKKQAQARLGRKKKEEELLEAKDKAEQKLADMNPGERVLYLLKGQGRAMPDD
mmetsp:Transcript_3114/g.7787  ORF Transcript_3114/g.7787 Transcript_3114/m.7787 type:complete len:303 (+) Transcript_3114:155-1063(+)